MAFEYKAISNGTLNNPYRFIEKDQIVVSDVEIKSKWLVSIEAADKIAKEPLMSHMNTADKPQPRAALNGIDAMRQLDPASVADQAYTKNIQTLQKFERAQDVIIPQANAAPDKPPVNQGTAAPVDTQQQPGGEAAQKGTGDQDVLG